MRFEPAVDSLRIASLIVLPLIIPVYIHDFIFDYFVLRKQYLLYLLCVALLVLFFGYIIGEFQHYFEHSGNSESYSTLLLIMILFTGARYFRIGTQQRMALKEEEKKRINAEMELKELEAKQSQAELNLLKSQVNPHFLFNTLNSIYSLILNNSEIAADTVIKLSDLMRYLVESSKKRKVLVKHEFEFLQNYIDLETIRLGKKAQVVSSFKGDLSGKIISPLLLIPFIENCFKHGISVNSKNNKIVVSLELFENTVTLQTSNRIAPQRINPSTAKSGTGIINVSKRLELLYPEKHKLEIKNEENSYTVKLGIEL